MTNAPSQMPELKPCQCGKKPKLKFGKTREGAKTYTTNCVECLCGMNTGYHSQKSGASIVIWNTRAASVPSDKERAEALEELKSWQYRLGETVRKKGDKGQWHGVIVGFYSTECTTHGYAVESVYEANSVQIYPESAIEPWTPDKIILNREDVPEGLDEAISAYDRPDISGGVSSKELSCLVKAAALVAKAKGA